jgi:protein phosphatase methylesterase 1
MQVLTRCGHAVHEDCPEEVAQVVASFMLRHKFAESPLGAPIFSVQPGC